MSILKSAAPIIEISIVVSLANYSCKSEAVDETQSLGCRSFWFIILWLLAILKR